MSDLNASLEREDIFNPTNGNESLHFINNDSGVRVVNVATLQDLTVKVKCSHVPILIKYTWATPDGNTCNQIDHVLINKHRK